MISSDEQTITLALKMLCGLLPNDCFFGNGTTIGPSVVMTDNCDELRNVIRMKWPNTKLLLCVFHILQQIWRWVFEKNNNIEANHRGAIMVLFKELLYSSSIEELDGSIKKVLENTIILKYHDLKLYLGSLINRKEEWAICYRQNLLVLGSQTNNYVESQFLVLKDTILRRTRQFNINALLTKIFDDFEEHFKLKLLSVADGSFDCIYSKRFKGLNQKSGNGFKVASNEVQEIVLSGCIHQGNNFFIVPSKSSPNKTYMVDMTIGRCECQVGSDGSPCFHQFILWKNGLSTSSNFLPYLDKTERKRYAELAIGASLDLSYYDSLHSFLQTDAVNHSEQIDDVLHNEPDSVPIGNSSSNTAVPEKSNEDFKELARIAHARISDKLLQHIGENVEYNKSIIKFEDRLNKLSDSQLNPALNQFGSLFFAKTHRGKIFTQPTAVSRRKRKIGSRRKQDTRGDSSKRSLHDNLPQRRVTLKHRHNITEMIDSGLPSAKKSGSHKMKSNVTSK